MKYQNILLTLILSCSLSTLAQEPLQPAVLDEVPLQEPVLEPATLSPMLEIQGELGAALFVYERPTAVRNYSKFDLSYFELLFSGRSPEANQIRWNLALGYLPNDLRDIDTGEKTLALSQANIEIRESGTDSYFIMGLLPDIFVSEDRESWSGYMLGSNWASQMERSGLLVNYDYGARWNWVPNYSSWSAGVGLSNGEGYLIKETGPYKDLSIWVRWESKDSDMDFGLLAQRGNYEALPFSKNPRNRAAIIFNYYGDFWDIGWQSFAAQDAIDGLNSSQGWQGANLSSRGGEIANGVGHQLRAAYHLSSNHGFYAQLGQVDPDREIKENSLNHLLLAYEYSLGSAQKLWIGKVESQYEKNFNPGSDDKSEFALGLLLNF